MKYATEAFFLRADRGERFCLLYRPVSREAVGAIVYVHPFAEEMNKTRRVAAIQARAFAELGFAVLQMDLFGCGDSSGDFGDATWKQWIHDVATALAWMSERTPGHMFLWGARLGATLALDYISTQSCECAGLILWQPVVNGRTFLTQFLRLKLAREVVASGSKRITVDDLRESLNKGFPVEVAGYTLDPGLARSIDSLRVEELTPAKTPVRWFEVGPEPLPHAGPSARIADLWQSMGIDFRIEWVEGQQFWATQEIAECPQLVEASSVSARGFL